MERIFWIECPDCQGRFYCDYELRHAGINLCCPYCQHEFKPEESHWLDERS